MPLDSIDEAAGLGLLAFARPAYAMAEAGAAQSQNLFSMNADQVQSLGFDGSGITVGILSDSFDTRVSPATNLAQDVANGDLPSGIVILADFTAANNSQTDEGRAMAQLIHDVAPGADLMFHTAFLGMADFAQGIIDLAAAGADIIVDDIRYFAEPFFQDGIIAQAIDTVSAMGVMYFSSAGNYARRSFASAFVDSGETIELTLEVGGTRTLAAK
jgi:hypothetical protein